MKTDESLALFERLCAVMPGASTRTVTHYDPFPVCIDHCDGYRVWDVDGNEYIDLLNNYTPLVHGHAHPAIVEAITTTARRGLASALPSPIDLQGELAERLCSRTPSIELARFTNSASEAVMMAVRVARAYTGKDEIVFPGNGYHGSWDQVNIGGVDEEHPDGNPEGVLGIPSCVAALAHLVRFNDIAYLEAIMEEHGERVACILLEPILGHILEPGEPEFIAAAARLARQYGAILILDETITYRLWVGGWQTQHGIEADITTMGKTVGGGMPVGAFGGKAEFMSILDPRRPAALPAHGTMNGHALGMAAGCACLDLLDQPSIDRLNGMGERLAGRLHEAGRDAGIGMSVHACGSLLQVNCSDPLGFHRACLEEGLYIAPRGSMNLSTVMDEAVLDEIAGRWLRAVERTASVVTKAV